MLGKYINWSYHFAQTRGYLFKGTTERSVIGMCSIATSEMVAAFPELKRVRGHVYPGGPHWWCVTEDGEIVDPTVSQFECTPVYEQFDESKADSLPTGKCQNCGGYLYYNADACDENCMMSIYSGIGASPPDNHKHRYNPIDRPQYYG